VFAPTQAGAAAGTLTVADALRTQTVSLSGTGVQPIAVTVSPASMTFAAQQPGVASTAQTLTVTNGSGSAVANVAFTIGGPSASSFSAGATTCGATLANGSNCTVQVIFTPAALGASTATLTVSFTTPGAAPITVPLSGTGFDFAIAASGSATQTVASGQTAVYTLVLTPSNAMAGAFSFQCGTLPAYSVCSFSPTTESVAAGAVGNVTVQIATGQVGWLENEPGQPGWRVFPVLCGLVLLPLAWRRRKALLLGVLAAILVSGVASCSGSGGGSSGTFHNTPTGTFSVPVTVISAAVQHSFTLTLVVD
jgi:hypothetical protein